MRIGEERGRARHAGATGAGAEEDGGEGDGKPRNATRTLRADLSIVPRRMLPQPIILRAYDYENVSYLIYSRVRNKHTGTLINF